MTLAGTDPRPMQDLPAPLSLDVPASADNFDEQGYLNANPDVAQAVRSGAWPSGRRHFDACGHNEHRRMRLSHAIDRLRADKIARLKPLLRLDLPHRRRHKKYDFLTAELRAESEIADTENVGSNHYDGNVLSLINKYKDGVLLDCGAGKRQVYYSNVVNYDIVDYDTTDVIGIGEVLPFKDGAFDGIISVAVLEHVRDPFRCAAEIVRVLKPGGRLICAAPFLVPLHGYPHHYYNMTHQGLRSLFSRSLVIDDHRVIDSVLPIWSLTWIVQSWANGLPGDVRERFLDMPLSALLQPATELLGEDWVRQLPEEKNFELAAGTVLFAHKPGGDGARDTAPDNRGDRLSHRRWHRTLLSRIFHCREKGARDQRTVP
jgi:SAM-dependent methyltransferase